MIIDREVSTDIMLIIIVTFDLGNQYRMRRDSQRLVEYIQYLGLVTVLQIQIIEIVIMKSNSNKKTVLLLRVGCP